MNRIFLVAGGDLRFITAAERLARHGRVYAAGFGKNISMPKSVRPLSRASDLPERADCLVLPLPVSQDGVTVTAPYSGQNISLESLSPAVKEGGLVFGGMFSPESRRVFDSGTVHICDYAQREEFAVLNAVATAEGAIQAAMEELPTTLSGRRVLILGAGRIAKALIDALSGFHTRITVAARKCSDLAWAKVYGCEAVHISDLAGALPDAEIIFNTVPATLLDEQLLKKLAPECLVIDLASKPGGVDFSAAAELGVKAMWLLSLPGKTAPVTSGEVIARTIENVLAEVSEASERGEGDG